MSFPKRTDTSFHVLGFNGFFFLASVVKFKKVQREFKKLLSASPPSIVPAVGLLSRWAASPPKLCFVDRMFDPLPLFPAILQSPQLVRLLTHFNTLKGAGGVSGPRRLDPWRFSLFWWLLRPLPPGSAAQSVDSTRVLAWWQNLFCDRKVGLDYRSEGFQQCVAVCACRLHQRAHDIRPWSRWACMAEAGAGFIGRVAAFASLSWTAAPTRQGTSKAVRKELTWCVDPDNIQVAEVDAFFIIPAVAGAAFGPDSVFVSSLSWQLFPVW